MTEQELTDLKASEAEITRGPLPGDFWMIDLYVTRAMCRRGVSFWEATHEYRRFEKHVKGGGCGGWSLSSLMKAVRLGRTPWVKSENLPERQQKTPMDLYAACVGKVTNDG